MRKLFLALGFAAIAVSAASAQTVANNYDNDQLGTYERVTKSGPYLTGRFFDNMFIGIAGGVNLYDYTGGNNRPDFGDRLAPSIDVYIGKWVTPSVGLRIGYNGFKTKGLQVPLPVDTSMDDNLNKFNFMFIHGDFMWNISNAIGGYKETRFWNLVPFVGVGYARASKDDWDYQSVAGTAGLLNNFRLGHAVDLTLEGRFMLVESGFDGVQAGTNQFDQMYSLTAGLTFKFGPRGGFKRPVYNAPADYTPYERRISGLESDLSRERANSERLARELEAARNRPAQTVSTSNVNMSVFFHIGKANLSEREIADLKAAADIMKAQPNAKFDVTGYADAGTGSVRLNQELSTKRANAVADVLVNTYGVNRSQLNISGKGGVNIHAGSPALDRVVIVKN